MTSPDLSVVIPTVARSTLSEAIRSVRAQTWAGSIEIVVVADLADLNDLAAIPPIDLSVIDQLHFTGGKRRGGYARNLGIAMASAPWVALLDDDDTWSPSKLEVQFNAVKSATSPETTVFSSQVQQGLRNDGKLSQPTPSSPYRSGRIEDFLFYRRVPSLKRAGMYTSTLLLATEFARSVKWDESLSRHQDWDWLCRLQDAGADFMQVESPLVQIWSESAGSISSSTDWRSSLEWARGYKSRWKSTTYADFIAGQAIRYAVAGRSVSGLRDCIREITNSGSAPTIGPIVLGIGGILPRRVVLSGSPKTKMPTR